MTKDNISNKM